MANDNYDDMDDEAGPSKAESGPDTAVATMDDKDSKSGSTLPRGFFGDKCAVGQTYKVKVGKILDNELLVTAVPLDGKDRPVEELDPDADAESEPDLDDDDSGNY